jgi:hypothetical protein
MRKRKSPIVLITTLAVMCSVAFGLQFASSKTGGAGSQPPAPEMPDVKAVGTPRAPEPKSTVAGNIQKAMGAPSAGTDEAMRAPGPKGRPGEQTGSMVLNPTQPMMGKPEKPKPNSSSTSAHWYDKDSAAANQG